MYRRKPQKKFSPYVNIIGRWCPSLGATGTRLLDRSGRNQNGTLTNMDPATDWVASGSGLALDFDGSNDGVNGTTNTTVTIYPFTIAGWANVTAIPATNGSLISLGISNSQYFSIGFVNVSSTLRAAIIGRNTAFTQNNTTTAYSLGSWIHLAGVFDSATSRRLYVNGVRVLTGTTSVTELTTGNGFRIGSQFATQYLNALIDDCIIWNRGLTDGEIWKVFVNGRGDGLRSSKWRTAFQSPGATFNNYWLQKSRSLIGGGVR